MISAEIKINPNLPNTLRKKNYLGRETKYVLGKLSHYKFKQQLAHKCAEHGCELKIVTEEYTSQCCTKCGMLSKIYTNRLKKCTNCSYEINRDINGARNIFLKNHRLVSK